MLTRGGGLTFGEFFPIFISSHQWMHEMQECKSDHITDEKPPLPIFDAFSLGEAGERSCRCFSPKERPSLAYRNLNMHATATTILPPRPSFLLLLLICHIKQQFLDFVLDIAPRPASSLSMAWMRQRCHNLEEKQHGAKHLIHGPLAPFFLFDLAISHRPVVLDDILMARSHHLHL